MAPLLELCLVLLLVAGIPAAASWALPLCRREFACTAEALALGAIVAALLYWAESALVAKAGTLAVLLYVILRLGRGLILAQPVLHAGAEPRVPSPGLHLLPMGGLAAAALVVRAGEHRFVDAIACSMAVLVAHVSHRSPRAAFFGAVLALAGGALAVAHPG